VKKLASGGQWRAVLRLAVLSRGAAQRLLGDHGPLLPALPWPSVPIPPPGMRPTSSGSLRPPLRRPSTQRASKSSRGAHGGAREGRRGGPGSCQLGHG